MNDTLTLRRVERLEEVREAADYLGFTRGGRILVLIGRADGGKPMLEVSGEAYYVWGDFAAVYEIPRELSWPNGR